MAKKRKKTGKKPHPTLFVFDGSIRYFKDGSMLELYTGVSAEEWAQIVEETIGYKVFLDCLKEVAFPILREQWTKEDEWYRFQLEVAVSRMRNLDPLLVIRYDQAKMKASYSEKMKANAAEVVESIQRLRNTKLESLGGDVTQVSDL